MTLKQTLNLPDADFTIPMKAELPMREPEIQRRWREQDVYRVILDGRRGRPKFILHDGPPYTNSMVHMGTVLNKSLKDFVVKYKTLRGFHAPYVPGYDNHGLPIELAVQERIGTKASPKEMRTACRSHAESYIQIQTSQFERMGVFGEWSNPYSTMAFSYEASIIRAFAALAEKGFIYRDLKPTHWSTHSQTALADTELVYETHNSHAIYVRFPLKEDLEGVLIAPGNVYAVIWTTTPWTIPANLALAFHPELTYCLVETDGDFYLILDDLAFRVMETLDRRDWVKFKKVSGADLEGIKFSHPLFERDSVAVLGDYVNTQEGTGIVHTAPGHGADDFYTGRKYHLPILCPVDEAGIFTKEAGEFAGLHITEGGERVVERLREVGNLLKDYTYEHQYPYSERDKHPVIFRTTEQWFLRIDHEQLRSRALEEIQRVRWFPPAGEQRIAAMVTSRPDWCLSRQRIWGVGIPIVYGKESRIPVLDSEIMENAAKLVGEYGSGAWFEADLTAIIPSGYRHPETGETEFVKETDVLDVWFDSGITHLAVLRDRPLPQWSDLEWPADLYLEGSDQHRGWFNSSLITAVAIMGKAPYRQVLTHGFLVDEDGRKMSKSLGNVVEPVSAADRYGADIIRLWAGSVDYSADVPCGEGLLKQMGDTYRRIRNTLRFLLSNLSDYPSGGDSQYVSELDRWAVDSARLLTHRVCSEFDEYDFSAATNLLHNYCVRELSAFYLDAIKDTMYCDAADSATRRSAQRACKEILLALTRLVAPILCHTAEEVYERIPLEKKNPTVFLEEIECLGDSEAAVLIQSERWRSFTRLLEFKDRLYVDLERWKSSSDVKDLQDVLVRANEPKEMVDFLQSFGDGLPTMLKISGLEVNVASEEFFEFSKSEYLKCERCRLRRDDVELRGEVPLCTRCNKVVSQLS